MHKGNSVLYNSYKPTSLYMVKGNRIQRQTELSPDQKDKQIGTPKSFTMGRSGQKIKSKAPDSNISTQAS